MLFCFGLVLLNAVRNYPVEGGTDTGKSTIRRSNEIHNRNDRNKNTSSIFIERMKLVWVKREVKTRRKSQIMNSGII